MKIFVKVKPRARESSVEMIDATHFVVAVKEPPLKGQANAAVLRALAQHFQVGAECVRIISGYTSRQRELLGLPLFGIISMIYGKALFIQHFPKNHVLWAH